MAIRTRAPDPGTKSNLIFAPTRYPFHQPSAGAGGFAAQPPGIKGERNNMEEKKIEMLYELLERAEREKDTEAAAALRWAIFQIEK